MSFLKLYGLFFFGILVPFYTKGISFESKNGVVRAMDGDAVVWENIHDRRGIFQNPKSPGFLTNPIQIDDETLFYAVGLSLFQVSTGTGIVQRRITLPGLCTALTQVDAQVEVSVQFSAPNMEVWEERYRVGTADDSVPFFLPVGHAAAFMSRHDAEAVLTSATKENSADEPNEEPEEDSVDTAVIEELMRLQDWDATNPWYAYWRGVYLKQTGRLEEAESAFSDVLSLDEAYDFELLPMALLLDQISPDMGQQAFTRGMTFLLHHGYDPEMTSTLVTVVVQLGSFGSLKLDPEKDLDRLNLLGERLWDFAPYAEWSAGMYGGLAKTNRAAGNHDQANRWEKRAEAALPYRHFGFGSKWADATGHAINVLIAGWIAMILFLVVKLLRYLPARLTSSSRWKWNPFCVWTRGEIAGFLIVQVVLMAAWITANRGVTFIGNAAALPISTVSGNFGHPESLAYLSRFTDTQAGKFVYALALQKANRLEEAADLYMSMESPRAKNNLGVIRQTQGDRATAEQLYKAALAQDPSLSEAAFNLGQETRHPRIERAKKFGLEPPLYAMPTLDQWARALTGNFRMVFLSQTFGISHELSQSSTDPAIARAEVPTYGLLTGFFFFLLAVCAIMGLIFKAEAAPISPKPKRNLIGWALGFIIPGTARQWSILGAPVLTLCIFSLLVFVAMGNSEGTATNILDAISMPHLAQTYGVWTMMISPLERLVRIMPNWWWILFILNPLIVVGMEFFNPDPWGPRKNRHTSN